MISRILQWLRAKLGGHPAPLPPFDAVGAAMYLSEVRDLTDLALYLFTNLENAADGWLTKEAELDSHLSDPYSDPRPDIMLAGLETQQRHQVDLFDALSAFLGVWSRLSLLLFPLRGPGRKGTYRRDRGRRLRRALAMTNLRVLEDRGLRDAWMHLDERMDDALTSGRLGSRQRFTLRARITPAAQISVLRLVAVDTLEAFYPDRNGVSRSTDLRLLGRVLQQLERRLKAMDWLAV